MRLEEIFFPGENPYRLSKEQIHTLARKTLLLLQCQSRESIHGVFTYNRKIDGTEHQNYCPFSNDTFKHVPYFILDHRSFKGNLPEEVSRRQYFAEYLQKLVEQEILRDK